MNKVSMDKKVAVISALVEGVLDSLYVSPDRRREGHYP